MALSILVARNSAAALLYVLLKLPLMEEEMLLSILGLKNHDYACFPVCVRERYR